MLSSQTTFFPTSYDSPASRGVLESQNFTPDSNAASPTVSPAVAPSATSAATAAATPHSARMQQPRGLSSFALTPIQQRQKMQAARTLAMHARLNANLNAAAAAAAAASNLAAAPTESADDVASSSFKTLSNDDAEFAHSVGSDNTENVGDNSDKGQQRQSSSGSSKPFVSNPDLTTETTAGASSNIADLTTSSIINSSKDASRMSASAAQASGNLVEDQLAQPSQSQSQPQSQPQTLAPSAAQIAQLAFGGDDTSAATGARTTGSKTSIEPSNRIPAGIPTGIPTLHGAVGGAAPGFAMPKFMSMTATPAGGFAPSASALMAAAASSGGITASSATTGAGAGATTTTTTATSGVGAFSGFAVGNLAEGNRIVRLADLIGGESGADASARAPKAFEDDDNGSVLSEATSMTSALTRSTDFDALNESGDSRAHQQLLQLAAANGAYAHSPMSRASIASTSSALASTAMSALLDYQDGIAEAEAEQRRERQERSQRRREERDRLSRMEVEHQQLQATHAALTKQMQAQRDELQAQVDALQAKLVQQQQQHEQQARETDSAQSHARDEAIEQLMVQRIAAEHRATAADAEAGRLADELEYQTGLAKIKQQETDALRAELEALNDDFTATTAAKDRMNQLLTSQVRDTTERMIEAELHYFHSLALTMKLNAMNCDQLKINVSADDLFLMARETNLPMRSWARFVFETLRGREYARSRAPSTEA
ncbi:hypothetical protein CAOG_06892 [Capsaspora owczarzaki ATCC 30864]|uniref:Uncharacterized protein n=1 Tax=Capsaspora owczarzaki (strain ATCC 30864) TaxID=595528 RepID=A0A0D2UNP9_CAPO3|nr:hypothetical protein CAOG_06892 [Capsaspora owczarzaki ATCC 30864]KJE96591.1 hypothetical protein CAOG_006892 [Capsaspora owczarzaki ATCC 30864]|eukprot:XP_004344513.1 hypothetical protein CAOG_06892 [Capsaspora owczarzaki ATCC 30864]